MPRVLLIDDSASARNVIASRLRDHGFVVVEARDGTAGAELALADPPDVVVTDLWMPGISGVQLCRLLRGESRTKDVPVVLVTAESAPRTRFWARCAGAAAYVAKSDPQGLLEALHMLSKTAATQAPSAEPRPPRGEAPARASRETIQERLSRSLDAALFESVVAGEIRSLAQGEGEGELLFRGLAQLAAEIATYRWLALAASEEQVFLHAHPRAREACEAEARAALGLRADQEVVPLLDDRPEVGRSSEPLVQVVKMAGRRCRVALGPSERGASHEDRQLLSIIGAELGGPLRIVALVDEARRLAMTDPLTGLHNRRAFEDAMSRAISLAERHGHAMSVLLLDVDHFKRVNDTYGHEAGDMVLKGVATTLKRLARRSDEVGRWGGEEFVLGLPHAAAAGARVAAERLRRAIADGTFIAPTDTNLSVTASIGVAHVRKGETLASVVARADAAMYLAKTRGRNRVELAETP